MAFRELVPTSCLRPFVDRLWVQTAEGGDGGTGAMARPGQGAPRLHRILPDGCLDVILRLDGGEVVGGEVVGAMTRAQLVTGSAGELAAVRFRPGGAAWLLGRDVAELTDRSVPLDEVGGGLGALGEGVPRRGSRTRAGAAAPAGGGAGSPALAAVAELERRLVAQLARARAARPDPQIAYAVRRLFAAAPPTTGQLAEELGVCRQQLRRRVLRAVGLAPKELGRVARLQRAVARLQARRGEPLAQAAAALGYFDQAHMARDFRLIAGISAAAARAEVGSIFPIHSLLAPADCEA
jgi:AraC-like DNA-binding protein